MKRLNLVLCVSVVLLLATAIHAAEPSLKVEADKPESIYKVGETITFGIQVLEDGEPVAGRPFRWSCRGDGVKEQKGKEVSAAEPVRVTTSLDHPGFVRLSVELLDEQGKPLKDGKGRPIGYAGGAGVEPEKIEACPAPEDFDAFWKTQKQKLAETPMEITMTPVPTKKEGVEAFDIRVTCAGGKPVSGYYARPAKAAPGSLMASVTFHGYGVCGASLREDPYMLTLDINTHGIENGKPSEYYKELGKTELQRYGFTGNEEPEKSYFLGMYLRVKRALEFIKAQPEWDGKNLIVMGGSQGGLQALIAAALDEQVSICFADKPWLCDLGGIELGRQRGWRPDYVPALGYFDPVHHARNIKKCVVLINSGLGDYVCPPSGIAAMHNNLASDDKVIVFIPGANHFYTPPGSRTAWPDYSARVKKAKERMRKVQTEAKEGHEFRRLDGVGR